MRIFFGIVLAVWVLIYPQGVYKWNAMWRLIRVIAIVLTNLADIAVNASSTIWKAVNSLLVYSLQKQRKPRTDPLNILPSWLQPIKSRRRVFGVG